MRVIDIEAFLRHPEVLAWLQTLSDCPPGMLRHGYGLLDQYWRVYVCDHWLCRSCDGCVLFYDDACRTVDRALTELVDMGVVTPVGRGTPLEGHTHDAGCSAISRIRGGETWDQRTAPAYIWGYESGDNLQSILCNSAESKEESCQKG